MNKVKKQFKDFWSYYRLTKSGVNMNGNEIFKHNTALLISAIVVCLLMFFQFMFADGLSFSISIFDFFIPFAVAAAIGSGVLTSKQPSLLAVSPFSPKQRMVFCYFAAILRALVLFIQGLLVLIVSIFIIGCLFSLAVGKWVFVINTNTNTATDSATYKAWFLLLLGVIHFFAFFAISHIDSAKWRTLSSIVYTAVILTLSLVVVHICDVAQNYHTSYMHFTTNLTAGLYGAHAAWILSIEGVLAALAIAASVFFVRKRYASTKI